jgi:hypothetical protein
MMVKLIHEVLDEARKKRSKAETVAVLQQNETWALKDILRGSMDSTVEFVIPDGDPPYTPGQEYSAPRNLLKEHKRFVYFVKGTRHDEMPQFKRERIFFEILEGIDPNDAKHVVNMVNKKAPAGISRPAVEEAFPGLLKDT